MIEYQPHAPILEEIQAGLGGWDSSHASAQHVLS